MIVRCILLFCITLSGYNAHAVTGLSVYAGGGLSAGMLELKTNQYKSNFTNMGYLAEAGAIWSFSDAFALLGSASVAETHGNNNDDRTDDYLEKATIDYTSLKAGFMIYNVTIAAGIKQINLKVHSVSTTDGSETNCYKESLPTYSIGYNFFSQRSPVFTTAGIEQTEGDFDLIKFKTMTLFLKLSFKLDP